METETRDKAPQLDRASAEISQLKALGLGDDRICLMLSAKYAREILQYHFPDVQLPPPPAAEDRARPRPPERSGPLVHIGQIQPEAPPAVPMPSGVGRVLKEDPVPLVFQYVPLIQCTFPHSEQPNVTTYTRYNGRLELTLATSRDGVGLPYGVPARLLTIYAATEVVRTKSREIFLGRTISEFLRKLSVKPTSGKRGSISAYQGQLERLIHAVFTVEENMEDGGGRTGIHIRKVLFAEEATLWSDALTGGGSSILLSEPLYESMRERSAPLALSAIQALRKSPMDLDLYAWLVYRMHHLKRPTTIPWRELAFQFGQSYTRDRDFRQFFLCSLKRVLKVYEAARVEPTPSGLMLSPSQRHITKTKRLRNT